jgi:2,3-bisphosphoglycerate-dependent phosphoglycerate mutase
MRRADLIFVRHGRPAINPATPPPNWSLAPEGRDDVAQLAADIAPFAPRDVLSSPEPKAVQTAEIIANALGLAVRIDHRLEEHQRPVLGFGAEEAFQAFIARVFAEPGWSSPGGESLDQARARLTTALDDHPTRPLIVVTHGTILSGFLASRIGVPAHDLWRSLGTPDAFVLDADGTLITRLGGG